MKIQSLNWEHLLKFLAACKNADERDWLMAVLAVNHGLRVSEIVGRWAVKRVKKQKVRYFHPGLRACDIKDGYISIVRLKGSERTVQPLVVHENPLLSEREAMERLALISSRNQRLFPIDRTTAWRHLQRHGRSAGVRLAAAHIRGMKHTLGTLAAENVPVKVLQVQMGHKNPKSTMAYYDVTPDQAAARIREGLKPSSRLIV